MLELQQAESQPMGSDRQPNKKNEVEDDRSPPPDGIGEIDCRYAPHRLSCNH